MLPEQELGASLLGRAIATEISKHKHPRDTASIAQALITAAVDSLPPRLGNSLSFVIGPLASVKTDHQPLDTLLEVSGSAVRYWDTQLVFTNLDLLTRREKKGLDRKVSMAKSSTTPNPEQVRRFSWLAKFPSVRRIILIPDAEENLPWLESEILQAHRLGKEVWDSVLGPSGSYQFRKRAELISRHPQHSPSTFLYLNSTNPIDSP